MDISTKLEAQLKYIKETYISTMLNRAERSKKFLNTLTDDYFFENATVEHRQYLNYHKEKTTYEVDVRFKNRFIDTYSTRMFNNKERYCVTTKDVSNLDYKKEILHVLGKYRRRLEFHIEDNINKAKFLFDKFEPYKFKEYNVIYISIELDSYYDSPDGHAYAILEKDGVLYYNIGTVSTRKVYFKLKNISLLKNINQVTEYRQPERSWKFHEHEREMVSVLLDYFKTINN